MLENSENNGTEEIGLVTPTPGGRTDGVLPLTDIKQSQNCRNGAKDLA